MPTGYAVRTPELLFRQDNKGLLPAVSGFPLGSKRPSSIYTYTQRLPSRHSVAAQSVQSVCIVSESVCRLRLTAR